MIEIIIKVLTNWQVIAAATLFILVLKLLFSERRSFHPFKLKRSTRKKKIKENNIETSSIKKDEPGKLYVPDSTYEILKKEGIMHNHNDK